MKKITIVWTITLLIIVGGLTAIGLKFKKENINDIMEKSLVEQAKKYLGLYTSEYPVKNKSTRLDYERLLDMGYDAKLEKDCTGYIIIENRDMGYTYKAYLKCPEYTTKGYTEK